MELPIAKEIPGTSGISATSSSYEPVSTLKRMSEVGGRRSEVEVPSQSYSAAEPNTLAYGRWYHFL